LVDAAGNLRGLYSPASPGASRILIGSHLDTVPNAGAFDGILGVVLAVGLVESLEGLKLPFGIEVIGFSEEEGVRFGVPFIGSRALVGRADEELLGRKDGHGISVRKAIQDFGLDPNEISRAALNDGVLAYIEFHIEQGPVLENLERPLGVVEAIVGQNRLEFTFSGQANHAGTTPMNMRHDALASAAEWIVAVDNLAQGTPGIVATVGFVEAKPGAMNVIAGEARATLDIRHASDRARTDALNEVIRQAESIAARRGVTVKRRTLLAQRAVAMDPFLTEQIEHAIKKAGCEAHRMASGAGHDAMILAEKVPAAMIFLRTPGGISHDPAESVYLDDVAKALECGRHLLTQLAASQKFLGRTCRA
jgi:allantoate deiminase